MIRRAVAVVSLAALGLMPATADARWVRDAATSSSSRLFGDLALGFDTGGRGIVAWRWVSPGPDRDQGYGFALRDAHGTWSRARSIRDDGVEFLAAAYGGPSRGLLVTQETAPGDPAPDGRVLRLRTVRPDGRIGEPAELDPGHLGFGGAVAIDRAGRALLAWTRADAEDGGVYVREMDRSGGLGPVRRLARAGWLATIAVGDGGAAAVAWEDGGRLEARVRRGADARFGATDDVGPFNTEDGDNVAGGPGEASLAIAGDGRMLAAWAHETLVRGGPDTGSSDSSDTYVAAAAPGRAFDRPVHVQHTGPIDNVTADAAFTSRGTGIAVWSGRGIRYALLSGGRLGPRRLIRDGTDPALAGGPGNRALVAWTPFGRGAALFAAPMAPGAGAFGAFEPIRGAPGRDEVASSATVAAYDPRTGRPSVAWLGAPSTGTGDAVFTAERR